MLEEKIIDLREKLDKSIQNGEDYEIIYELSTQLDELIIEHYNVKMVSSV